ncbi:MAG: hypothetical protein D3906_00270 [Candidatus Electrothrix sp. AUS1_2]|nr:hypothetical protein [Candidatus Electrothrix sp. AUS1_2]
MKLHDIRKRELLKEKERLQEAKSLQVTREYLDATRRDVELQEKKAEEYGGNSRYHAYASRQWYKKNLNEYKKKKYDYDKKYKFFPEKDWHIKHFEIFNYNYLIKEINSFLLHGEYSDKIAVLFAPDRDNKYKIYLSFVDKKDEIITLSDKKFGRQIITNKIDSELKNVAINNNLILSFNIRNGSFALKDISPVHLDIVFYPQYIEAYKENMRKIIQHKSIIFPFQMVSILSGIIVFVLMIVENYLNITIYTQLVLGIGIGFPAAGVLFFDLLQEDRIPIISENLKKSGNVLICFGCIVLFWSFFSKVTNFSKLINIILNAAWPIAVGIWMVEISSEKVPKKIISSITDRFCDECIGRGRLETASCVSNCFKCSGTGLYGEYIEQLLRIKDIVSRRRSAVISALLYPVVLSLLFIMSR